MDDYQSFIYKSRYARWLPEEGRREEWPETIDRYFNFFEKHLREKHGYVEEPEVVDWLKKKVLNLEVMPSMRCLMTAGPALERSNIAAFNCFAGSEQYMTQKGLKSFKDTVGTEQLVLAGDGVWRLAQIKSFGKQKLNKIVLRPGAKSRTSLRLEIFATPDHRWITANRGEVTDLAAGDVIDFVGNSDEFNVADFIRGFGYGDGTIDSGGRARVRLCGKKANYLPLFEEFGNCRVYFCPSAEGDPLVVFDKNVFTDWKQLPEIPSYSWFAGYLAADGHNNSVQPGLSTQSADAVQYLLDNSAYGGVCVTGLNWLSSPTNYGNRSAPLGRIGLREEAQFKVMEVQETDRFEEVFCAVEPVTNSFVLRGGVLTGNCSYLVIDKPESFHNLMLILLNGTGVGYSVERQYVNKFPEVPATLTDANWKIVVEDSKEGWATSLLILLNALYQGQVPQWDLSKIRPAGARLHTFGGRASGPGPLDELFRFVVDAFKKAKGRKLTSIECHDIACKIGEVVVVGGVDQ